MIITAFNCPGPEGYPLLKKAGINTVWDAAPDCTTGLDFISGMTVACECLIGVLLAPEMRDDVPIATLLGLEESIQTLKLVYPDFHFPVLVSATYTRMLDYLGAESIEEYYQKFAELAPSATPMLCHYPFHVFLEEDGLYKTENACWRDYCANLGMMERIFDSRWWAWVQLTSHSHYGDEWYFPPLGPGEVKEQVATLVDHGCSGIGYFSWKPIGDAEGIMAAGGEKGSLFEAVAEINKGLN